MKRRILFSLIALLPLSGTCQELFQYWSPKQSTGDERGGVRILVQELTSGDSKEKLARVNILIAKPDDGKPIPMRSIQRVQILDAGDWKLEYRDKNPLGELQADNGMGGMATFVVIYELANAEKVRDIQKVTFSYLNREYVFDLKTAPTGR